MAKAASAKSPPAVHRPPRHTVRRALVADFPAILRLEEGCFEPYRRASHASLRRSLTSKHQSFWVVDHPAAGKSLPKGELGALLVLWHFPHRWRVYDVATHPDLRGHGVGTLLMHHAESLAVKAGATLMSLEAEKDDPRLVAWYEHQGYQTVDLLKDFYHKGCHALRMRKTLTS